MVFVETPARVRMSLAFFKIGLAIGDWQRMTFHFTWPRDVQSEERWILVLDLDWLLQSPGYKLSWIAWTWLQDNDLVYLTNLSESDLYFIVQIHQSSDLILLEHYNGSCREQFIFSLFLLIPPPNHEMFWSQLSQNKNDTWLRIYALWFLFYFIILTPQSYPSVCSSVRQSTSFMICPTSPTFQTFFPPNKTCSPSLRQGEWGKGGGGVCFQFIHPTNGPFTWLLISFITLFKMSFALIIFKPWVSRQAS